MTKDDIIKLAREAGFDVASDEWHWLERFANLVSAHKAEVITAEAYRCGYKAGMEAAAVICESLPMQRDTDVWDECAAAIRMRNQS